MRIWPTTLYHPTIQNPPKFAWHISDITSAEAPRSSPQGEKQNPQHSNHHSCGFSPATSVCLCQPRIKKTHTNWAKIVGSHHPKASSDNLLFYTLIAIPSSNPPKPLRQATTPTPSWWIFRPRGWLPEGKSMKLIWLSHLYLYQTISNHTRKDINTSM